MRSTRREVGRTKPVQLRPADADWLAQEQIKVMISLDGVGELHNELRPLRNRAGFDTFAAVAHTVDHVLLPRNIRPDVNMVVTGRNAHGAADLARWTILERALPTTFTFYRPNLMSRNRAELQFEEEALIRGMLAAYDTVESELPTCLLYTSDAADERSSVDLGGRRTIKKKNSQETTQKTKQKKKKK